MGITKTMQLEEMEREHEAQRLADAELELQLPRPAGYRVLVALPQPEDKFEGTNILKTEKAKQQDHIMSIIGLVVDMGSGAYADKERFPDGPWCKEGDWVCIGRYSGSRFKIDGGEVRIINDDEVIATLLEPDDIKHI